MRALVQAIVETLVIPPVSEPPRFLGAERVTSGADLRVQPPFPFATHRLRLQPPTPSGNVQATLEVWFYDDAGSWARIDPLLNQCKLAFAQYPFGNPSTGPYIAVVDFESFSPDLPAEEFHGISRMAAFNLVGRTA